jgi:hypothetical protein
VPDKLTAQRAVVGAAAFEVEEELHAVGSRPLSITAIAVVRESHTMRVRA